MAIKYFRGDATNPNISADKHYVIMHICNNRGGWGAGFVLALSKRWKRPEQVYRSYAKEKKLKLGDIQVVPVEINIDVANMIAQDGFSTPEKPCVLDYKALEICLEKLRDEYKYDGVVFAGPKFGCGLAGGDWPKIEKLINMYLDEVHIYEPY